MQTLQQYMFESIVNESFQSDILRNFWMGLQKSGRNRGSYFYMLQWDKIKDDDLKKLTKDEALKRMRSQKDPGYLLWVSDKEQTKYGWRDGSNTTYHYNGATWGWDVCLTYDGDQHNVRANHIADMADYAYEIIDPKRFLVKDIQFARREARNGALALMDAWRIAEKNRERYKEALANMRTPDAEQCITKFEEINEMYKNVVENHAKKIVQYLQEGTPSYYDLGRSWQKINDYYNKLIERLHKIKEYKGSYDNWAFTAYKEFNELVREFEKLANDFMQKFE